MALDYPETVTRIAVLDIVTVLDAWEHADDRFALAFWPWSLLAQPAPLPERLVAAAPDAIIDDALGAWGTPPDRFSPEIRATYIKSLDDAAHVHSICEEYRAASTIDRAHDEADRAAGRRIMCPVLVLWSGQGALASWYETTGGPLAVWRGWADDVQGRPVAGGHFFPEVQPHETAEALREFFRAR
jgi:haloacetate dehalogenase